MVISPDGKKRDSKEILKRVLEWEEHIDRFLVAELKEKFDSYYYKYTEDDPEAVLKLIMSLYEGRGWGKVILKEGRMSTLVSEVELNQRANRYKFPTDGFREEMAGKFHESMGEPLDLDDATDDDYMKWGQMQALKKMGITDFGEIGKFIVFYRKAPE